MPTTSLQTNFFTKRFYLLLFILTAIAFLLRAINITYASLWSDELYSMLSVHPDNSWYEVLYMQRKDQPPVYFVLLSYWTKLFGYNDMSARGLSVIIGTLSILAIGFVNEKIFNAKVGLLSAFTASFGFVQIEHSLEARFYGLLFLLITISIYTYWLTANSNYKFLVHIIHGGLCGGIILTHHFGAMVVMTYGIFDLVFLIKKRFQLSELKYKAVIWITVLLVLAPWFWFSYSSVKEVRTYWLKIIDIPAYLLYNIRYSTVLFIFILLLTVAGYILAKIKVKGVITLLIVQILLVVIVPVFFSYMLFPMLVPRYSFAMGPAIFTLLSIGLVAFAERMPRNKIAVWLFILSLLSFDGLKASLFNKDPLRKEPWREMAEWLRQQPDLQTTTLYSVGYQLKKRFTLDYYLPEKKVVHMQVDTAGLSLVKRFYLVETNGHDVLKKTEKDYLKSKYEYKEVFFGYPVGGQGGTITIFTVKN
jgi:4-amino-4-deoxy-L-arabinose transferase-like glycosyltransferase